MGVLREPSGHVFRVDRFRGRVWYANYRLPDGRQLRKRVGPAWSERGRPPAGYFARRTAEAWRRDLLDQARRGTLPGLIRTGATFADAARPAVPQPRTVEWHLKKVFIRLGISSRMGLHGALPSADREATPA
ncbi:MAG TPA: hypothetical protein VHF51_07360 [Solirubrobacteraceae bacterium]|nr:hypothetical protein [Solirubrobacteraceae bacterium]